MIKHLAKFSADNYYHVINHGVGSENLFRSKENYRYFLEKYSSYTSSVWDTYAYCLMPNHFHLLVKVHPSNVLEIHEKYQYDEHKLVMQCVSNWLNAYAKAYNKMYERKGALFLDYTKRFEIQTEEYFTSVVNYIHQNPVHHGFCENAHDWLYSSYHAFLSERTTYLKRDTTLQYFGGKDAFMHFHTVNKAPIDMEWEY